MHCPMSSDCSREWHLLSINLLTGSCLARRNTYSTSCLNLEEHVFAYCSIVYNLYLMGHEKKNHKWRFPLVFSTISFFSFFATYVSALYSVYTYTYLLDVLLSWRWQLLCVHHASIYGNRFLVKHTHIMAYFQYFLFELFKRVCSKWSKKE